MWPRLIKLVRTKTQLFRRRTKFIEPKNKAQKDTILDSFKEHVNFFEPTDVVGAYDSADSIDTFIKQLK